VADFIRFAREQRIQTTCRGSAPGSIVTYTLGITPVDPIAYQLPFERFLNPDRVTMPDIDVDFEDGRRDEVIAYVGRKYGQDHVAQIITFGTMLARAAIRDVGRVLGHSYGDVDRVAKAIPNQLGIRLTRRSRSRPRCASRSTTSRASSGSSSSHATSRASRGTPPPTRPGSSSVASRSPS
jgi:DNA polymerase-3 subunit alpha